MGDLTIEQELLERTQRLLDCISQADWETYQELCDTSLTAFEPESLGQRIEGLAFHEYFFQLGGVKGLQQTLMTQPHVRVMENVAVVTYVRVNQRLNQQRSPEIHTFAETRVWHRIDGEWKHVHFHRSLIPGGWTS